ncbi:MAG TPA: GNAT family N-acetyltransferase [Bryobacteraceae bacterium]|nr:GNAT family N-acetyltransferase [Bryobacteraceae bacterium]
MAKLKCVPVTPERWPDLEALFGERGACGGCWCMAWRLPRREWEAGKGEPNRRALRRIVRKGPPPGIIAYCGRTPVGWCAVAPRKDYAFLERSRVLRPLDTVPVWSVSCLFVRRPFRRRGVSVALLRAAVRFVREQGGTAVEGYPVEPRSGSMPDTFAWTGLLKGFLEAGFIEMPRWSESRPIVRYVIEG